MSHFRCLVNTLPPLEEFISLCHWRVESKTGRMRRIMKLPIARDGKVIGEWTKTKLYPLLRASEVFPSDCYWDEETSRWRRLAELPCGKSVLATPAQRQLLTNYDLPWDEFTTKYQVQELMESRPAQINSGHLWTIWKSRISMK